MRYKFRGRMTDNIGWVYGYYARVLADESKEIDIIITKAGDYEVMPESVGQWTGLVDKNGKEIYENDILRCVSRLDMAHMIVLFEEGEFRMVLCEDYDSYTTGMGFYALRCFEKEVIGNIHDNPELMEVE